MNIKLLLSLFLYLLCCITKPEGALAQTKPVISSFTPLSAAPGSSVTLTGSDFNPTVGNNIVFFGGVRATVTAASSSNLTVTVPANASYGLISVLNSASRLIGTSGHYFIPLPNRVRPTALMASDFIDNGSTPAASNNIFNLASSDLDNDGKPDLVSTSPTSLTTIFIHRNISTASLVNFSSPISHATGSLSIQTAPIIGDMNGDGRPDIVVTGHSSGTFTVLENTGNLSAFTVLTFPTAANAISAGIGDFDNDGRMDVVVGHSSGAGIQLYRNNSTAGGPISFEPAVEIAPDASFRIVVADLNGDGKTDILTGKGSGVAVLENTSNLGVISFSRSSLSAPPINSLTLGDLDKDGKLDLITTSPNTGITDLTIFRNTSAGPVSFVSQTLNVGDPQADVALGDLNGDGLVDLLIGGSTNYGGPEYRTSVLTNTSSTGAISFGYPFQLTAGASLISTLAGDLNGDGLADLLSVNATFRTIKIYRNALQYPPAITSFSPAKAVPGASVTLTGSGFNSDLVNNVVYFGPVRAAVTAATPTSLTVTVPFGATHALISVLNTGTGMQGFSSSKFLPVFTPGKPGLRPADIASRSTISTIVSPFSVGTADFDGDGKPDLLTTSSGSELRIHPNTSGSGTISFGTGIDLTGIAGARYHAVGDVDGDGKLDIAVSDFSSDQVSIFRNSGSGIISFDPKVDIATADGPYACGFADFDGDGRPELIVTSSTRDKISIFPNTSSGSSISFGPRMDITVGGTSLSSLVDDFDGDGKLDIAVTLSGTSRIAVLRNTGSGSISFDAPLHFSTGTLPWGIQSGDIDGDGKPDIVVTNANSVNVTVFRNTSSIGTANFEAGVNFFVAIQPRSVALGDINGDGRPDMVVANEGEHRLTVYSNISISGTVNFASPITLSISAGGPRSVILADLDLDGRPDIAAADGNASTISIFRNALIAAPTVQASGVSFSSTTATSCNISWTNGNGASRIVWIKIGNTGTPSPVDETTYTGNALFGLGNEIGSTRWYAVYKGTGSSVNVTGLSPGTVHQVMVTEYNGAAGLELYQSATATNNPVLLTTPSADAKLSTLVLSTGTLSPLFSAGTNAYSATVSPSVASITVTSTTNQGDASLEVRGNSGTYVAVTSGMASAALSLNGGSNTIDIKVTAQDGTTVNTYTINVLRRIDQLITFPAAASVTYGTADFDPGASSSNTGIAVSYVSSDPSIATIVSGKVHIVKAGVVNITAFQAGDATYVAAADKVQVLTIEPKNITLSLNASPAITKIYDGSGSASLVAGNYTLNGIETGDVVTVSGTASFDTKDVGTGKIVTTNNFVLAGAGKDNYSLTTASATTTGSITAKNITVGLNASPVITKIYDGLTSATLTSANYNLIGIETGDVVSASGTASYDTKDVGAGKTVTANNFVLAGAQKDNYSITTASGTTTGSVTAKNITVSLNASPAITKSYDGLTSATLTSANYNLIGIETGDVVIVSGTASYDTKDVGTGKTVTANSFVLAGAQKDNYSITTASGTTTGSVTAKNITVSLNASPVITKTYDGLTNATLTSANYILNGVETSDVVTVSGTASYDTKDAGTGKTVTASSFVLAGSEKDNYSLTTASATTTGSITAKNITVSLNASPAITKTYDGLANATLTTANYNLNGVETGDVVTVSGTATFDTKDAGTGKTVTASSFVFAGSEKDNYSLTTASATTTGSITAKNITVSLNAIPLITKTYDGYSSAHLVSGNYNLNGVENGDVVTISGTASFDTKNAGIGKTVTANGFVLAGTEKDNYNLTTSSATTTGSITAKNITLSLNAGPLITKTYDGHSSAHLVSGNYNLNGVENGDVVTVSGTASFDTKNAGIGKTVTANRFVLAGTEKDNYNLTTASATTTGSIAPKNITVSLNASPAISKIYDGLPNATLTSANYILNGVETGDVVTVSGTASFETKDVGTGKSVTANSFVLAGAEKDNYNLANSSATTTGSITVKTITVSLNANPAISKTYDGLATATLATANYTLNGIVAGDAVSVGGRASYDSKDVGSGKTVTANDFMLAGSEKGNYSLTTASATTTGSITAKNITVTLNANPAITKTYDGLTNATLTSANYTLHGIESGDELHVSATASFSDKNAGTGKTLTANNFTLLGAQKNNYMLTTSSATTTGSISPKSITLSLNASPAISKIYDGTINATLAEANNVLNGVIPGDAVRVNATASYDNKDAGIGKTVRAGNLSLSGAQKDNYSLLNSTAGTTGTIEKKILTVRADDQSRLQGESNPSFSLSYSGFVNGEGAGELSALPAATTTANAASSPGTYPIIPAGGSAANYSFSYIGGILSIGPPAFVNTAPTLDAIASQTVCYSSSPQTIALSGIGAGAGDGQQNITLSVSSTNNALFSSLNVVRGADGTAVLNYIPSNPAGGTSRITVTVRDDGGTANGGTDTFSRTFDLTISTIPVARISSDAGTMVSKGSTLQLTASGGTTYTWATAEGIVSGQNTATLTVRPFETTTYTVTASSGPACTSMESITIRVSEDYKMVASNFLTPNGDGKNDTWVIENIDAYPNNKVTVFDAGGRPVYEKRGYNNSEGWAGDVNGSPLTEGSYFYVIDFGGGERLMKGFITILKER